MRALLGNGLCRFSRKPRRVSRACSLHARLRPHSQDSAEQFILLLTLLGSTCQVASSAVRAVAGVLASGYAAVEMLMGSLGVRLPLHVCASAVLADTCMLSDPRTRGNCYKL